MHMPQGDPNISQGNTKFSFVTIIVHLKLSPFASQNTKKKKNTKGNPQNDLWNFPCITLKSAQWLLTFQKTNASHLRSWCRGAPCSSVPWGQVTILLHPMTTVGLVNPTLLILEENVFLCLNPLPSFLLTYNQEIPNYTNTWKPQSQQLGPREPELRHPGTSNHNAPHNYQFQVLQPELRHNLQQFLTPLEPTRDRCTHHSWGSSWSPHWLPCPCCRPLQAPLQFPHFAISPPWEHETMGKKQKAFSFCFLYSSCHRLSSVSLPAPRCSEGHCSTFHPILDSLCEGPHRCYPPPTADLEPLSLYVALQSLEIRPF